MSEEVDIENPPETSETSETTESSDRPESTKSKHEVENEERAESAKSKGGFPIEIETKINKLITYTYLKCV